MHVIYESPPLYTNLPKDILKGENKSAERK